MARAAGAARRLAAVPRQQDQPLPVDATRLARRQLLDIQDARQRLCNHARPAQQPTPKLVLVCPGYCATELTFNQGTDPPSKGAQSVTWPLFHADEAQHGHFYLHGVEQAYVQEPPQFYKDNMRMLAAMDAAKKTAAQ